MADYLTQGLGSGDELTQGLSPVAAVTGTFTYVPGGSDTVSRIRFAIADTDSANYLFEDAELLGAFAMPEVASNIQLAGAYALEAAAADNAKIAYLTKTGNIGNDESRVYQALLMMAKALRDRAVIAPVVIAPDAVFTIGSADGSVMGSMDNW